MLRLIPALLLTSCLANASALAQEDRQGAATSPVLPAAITSADGIDAYYPEGPLVDGEAVLFAEMHRDRVMRWQGENAEVLFEQTNCGPTAIAAYGNGYAVLCHVTNAVVSLAKSGATVERFDRDTNGDSFENPNDATADDAGGVYFSASGLFSRAAPATGSILYLAADGTVTRLASSLRYANGVVFDKERSRLLVSEHLTGRVLNYPVLGPGQLGRPSVFADLTRLALLNENTFPPEGPDGLEIDQEGRLYVAVYGRGQLLVFTRDGILDSRLQWQQPFITSVALADNDRSVVLTGSSRGAGRLWPGRVERLPNPALNETRTPRAGNAARP